MWDAAPSSEPDCIPVGEERGFWKDSYGVRDACQDTITRVLWENRQGGREQFHCQQSCVPAPENFHLILPATGSPRHLEAGDGGHTHLSFLKFSQQQLQEVRGLGRKVTESFVDSARASERNNEDRSEGLEGPNSWVFSGSRWRNWMTIKHVWQTRASGSCPASVLMFFLPHASHLCSFPQVKQHINDYVWCLRIFSTQAIIHGLLQSSPYNCRARQSTGSLRCHLRANTGCSDPKCPN